MHTNAMQLQECGHADLQPMMVKGHPPPLPSGDGMVRSSPHSALNVDMCHDLAQDHKIESILCEGSTIILGFLKVVPAEERSLHPHPLIRKAVSLGFYQKRSVLCRCCNLFLVLTCTAGPDG